MPGPVPTLTMEDDLAITDRVALLEFIYADQGYGPIRQRGEVAGVPKDPDGWQATIPAIAIAEVQLEKVQLEKAEDEENA